MPFATLYTTPSGAVRKTADDCRRLLALFDALRIKYETVIVETPEMKALVEGMSKNQDLPQCFVGDRFVGTYDDIAMDNEDGLLKDKLRTAGYSEDIRSTGDENFLRQVKKVVIKKVIRKKVVADGDDAPPPPPEGDDGDAPPPPPEGEEEEGDAPPPPEEDGDAPPPPPEDGDAPPPPPEDGDAPPPPPEGEGEGDAPPPPEEDGDAPPPPPEDEPPPPPPT